MDVDRKTFLLKRALGAIRDDKSYKGELLFTCPKCKHHKNKLCVNVDADKFHCWICGWGHRSSLEPIIKLIGDAEALEEYRASIGRQKFVPKHVEKPELPDEFVSLCASNSSIYHKHALEFLKRRGVTQEQIELYKLGFAEDGKYRFRVIVPSFDEYGSLNFFVGRTIYDDINYKHGQFDKDIVFNDLMVDWKKPVIITEGPFDAIAGGTNAIPLQGKFLDEGSKLFSKIVSSGVDVYMALDSDARRQQMLTARSLIRYGVKCFDVKLLGKKDMGEMTKEEVSLALKLATPIDGRLSLVRARMAS